MLCVVYDALHWPVDFSNNKGVLSSTCKGSVWNPNIEVQFGITLPETNIASENSTPQQESSIPTIHFLGAKMLVSGISLFQGGHPGFLRVQLLQLRNINPLEIPREA